MISHSSRASRAKQKPLKIIDRVHRQKDLMLDKVLTMLDKVFNGNIISGKLEMRIPVP